MDALEFIRERNRMCKSFGVCCNNCPADKNASCDGFAWKEELVSIVENWVKENPRKTRQSVFLEQWPNAQMEFGVLQICPKFVMGLNGWQKDGCGGVQCVTCRREFWMQEIK